MPSGLRCKRLTVCLGLPFGHLLKRADCSKRATQNLFILKCEISSLPDSLDISPTNHPAPLMAWPDGW